MSKLTFEQFLKNEGHIDKSLFKAPAKEKRDMPHIANNIQIPNYFYETDLLHLPTDKFGYKYALVVVDVYTKICDAVPIKDRTANLVLNGLKKIFNERKILPEPFILQMDQGKEFDNEKIKEYLKEHKIGAKYTLTNRHRQNAQVEAKNKQIGSLLLQYQNLIELKTGKISKAWVDNLPLVINYLNSKLKKPKKKSYYNDMVYTKYSQELLPMKDEVYVIRDYPKNSYDNKKTDNKFRASDLRYDPEPRIIENIIMNPNMPPLYQLNKEGTNKIQKDVAYTKQQLKEVKKK